VNAKFTLKTCTASEDSPNSPHQFIGQLQLNFAYLQRRQLDHNKCLTVGGGVEGDIHRVDARGSEPQERDF